MALSGAASWEPWRLLVWGWVSLASPARRVHWGPAEPVTQASFLLIGFAVMVLSSISDFWFGLEFPVIKGYPMLQTWENMFAFGMLFVYLSTATFGWNYYRGGK